MNARVFANQTSLSLTTALDTGSVFTPPTIPALGDIYLRFKLSEEIQDTAVLDQRGIHSIAARLGWKDRAPTQGDFTLTITVGANSATTADLGFAPTDAELKAAIDAALSGSSITEITSCTVTSYLSGQRIVFDDNTEQPVITCTDNGLWPLSFVDVDEVSFDGGFAYILQLRQAPVAETVVKQVVPVDAPVITELQAGSPDSPTRNAIQKLFIPPSFSGGSFRIVRGGVKTDPIVVPVSDIAAIGTRVVPLADEGGTFTVTEVTNGAYIEFRGTMSASVQSLMTIEVFESPAPDTLVRLDTRTDAMRTLMRGADASTGEIEVPFELALEVEDGITAGKYQDVIFRDTWTFSQRVSDDSHNVAADLDWAQPLSRTTNAKFSTDALLVGKRAYQEVIGDGSATSFVINHNLTENPNTFTADAGTDIFTAASHGYEAGDPVTLTNSGGALPAGLSTSTTYYVLAPTTNTFQLSTTSNGSAVDVTDAGTGTHSVRLSDGQVEYVEVAVWETGGSELRISPEDYTVARSSTDAVTVSGFASTPTAGQYVVIVQGYGRPATYQAHTHPLDETPEAKARIEALEARVTALEALAPGTLAALNTTTTDYADEVVIPLFGEVYPQRGRAVVPFVPGERIIEFDRSLLPRVAPALIPAIHDAAAEVLPVTSGVIAAPTSDQIKRIFQNQSGASIAMPVRGGYDLPHLGYAATDGNLWYPMVQYGTGESSYYGATLERTLWEHTVEAENLTASRTMTAMFAAGLAALQANTAVYCNLVMELGVLEADTTPGTPGGNLKDVAWVETPVLDQKLTLTGTPVEDVFGYRVRRDSAGDLTAEKLLYGKWSSATAPASARFALRARLVRWDTDNDVTNPRGFIAVSGPRFDTPGEMSGVGSISVL